MRNNIQLILRYIKSRIPEEILHEAFRPHETGRTLDTLIKEHVIIDMVLDQANLYTGKVKKILLQAGFLQPVDHEDSNMFIHGSNSVYKIPPEYRENRPISLVLDISYPNELIRANAHDYGGSSGSRSVANRADEMLTSFTMSPAYLAPQPILVDGHAGIIRLEPPISMHTDWILACCLEFDDRLTGMSSNMIPHLQKLCLIACQMYIYTKLWVKINMGQLVGGAALEAIRSVVEEYRDKEDQYHEALMKFRGSSLFSADHLGDYLSLALGS